MLNESRFWLAIAALIAGFFVSTADVARAADSAFTTKAPRAILMDAETGATFSSRMPTSWHHLPA